MLSVSANGLMRNVVTSQAACCMQYYVLPAFGILCHRWLDLHCGMQFGGSVAQYNFDCMSKLLLYSEQKKFV